MNTGRFQTRRVKDLKSIHRVFLCFLICFVVSHNSELNIQNTDHDICRSSIVNTSHGEYKNCTRNWGSKKKTGPT
jgi:hypothetical protein